MLKLCKSLFESKSASAAKEISRYLSSHGNQVSAEVAEKCIQLAIEAKDISDLDARDDVVTSLLQNCLPARRWLARRLSESVTTVFEEVFDIGNAAATGMAMVVTDIAAWPSESQRESCEKDVFLLALAKLMESGHDYDGRAMREIARLLSVDGKKIEQLVDEESFDAILAALDVRWPIDVRSQATVATAKFFEFAEDRGRTYLTKFITQRIGRQTNDGLIVAFSAAAGVFPIVPSIASALFLTEGFVPSLVPMLETRSKSRKVERAALEMLSAACMDGGCREAIAKHCLNWLHSVMSAGEDEARGQAAVVCAKISIVTAKSPASTAGGSDQDSRVLVARFKTMLFQNSETQLKHAVEGLAFASTQPKVKEEIVNDSDLLKKLLGFARYRATSNAKAYPKSRPAAYLEYPFLIQSAFGLLTIFYNITRYVPNQSEEQKRMAQLQAYANASKDTGQVDPLDDDNHVEKRCRAVFEADALEALNALSEADRAKGLSPTSLSLCASIILSLSRTSSLRGKMVQQGALPLLLKVYEKNSNTEIANRVTAAHAMARLLISADPNLVSDKVEPTAKSILSLMVDEASSHTDGPRDLLPTFEGLLALTNLVSEPRFGVGQDVVKAAFPKLVDFLTSSNQYIQRASTELICNLMTCPEGIEKFADGSKAAANNIHILLALADVEDVATRRAASGALAMITEFEAVAKAILARDRGMKIVVQLMEDEDAGCVHRGFVCVRNLVMMEGKTGHECRESLKGLGALDMMREKLRTANDEALLQSAVEIYKALNV